jgi:hypothetical protein
MTGVEFYEFLFDTFRKTGESICDGFTFQEWVTAEDGTYSLKYIEASGASKALHKDILAAAWDTGLDDRGRLQVDNTSPEYLKDSRLQLLNHLIKICAPLREQSHSHSTH